MGEIANLVVHRLTSSIYENKPGTHFIPWMRLLTSSGHMTQAVPLDSVSKPVWKAGERKKTLFPFFNVSENGIVALKEAVKSAFAGRVRVYLRMQPLSRK